MPALSDPKRECFAQLMADKRISGAEAYRQVTDKPGMSTAASSMMANKWIKRDDVSARIAELRAKTEARCSMNREEFVEMLVSMVRGTPGEATLDNPLCDSLISRGQRHAVFPMKSTIAAQLAKICGWDAPTKVEIEAGENLESFLGRLFGARRTLGDSGNGNGQQASVTTARR